MYFVITSCIVTQLAYSQLSYSLKSKSLPSVVRVVGVGVVCVVVTRYTFVLFDLESSFHACTLLLPIPRKYYKMGHIDPFLMGQNGSNVLFPYIIQPKIPEY